MLVDENEDPFEEKQYKSYPRAKYNTSKAFLSVVPDWKEKHPAKRFRSVILAEEIGSFN